MLGDLGTTRPITRSLPSAVPRPMRPPDESEVTAVADMLDAVMLLSRQLRSISRGLRGDGPLAGGHRDVLLELKRSGPRTVPQLARAWGVTRQHVQGLINTLEDRGCVEFIENPAHKRSRLVRITSPGEGFLHEQRRREEGLLSTLHVGVSRERLQGATEVLRRVGKALAELGTTSGR